MNTRLKLVRGPGRELHVGHVVKMSVITAMLSLTGSLLAACGGLVASPSSHDGSENGAGGTSNASTQHAALGTYVGRVDGSDAEIAIVYGEAGVTAYVCGGNVTYASHTRWFKGDIDSQIHLQRDGWSLDGSFERANANTDASDANDTGENDDVWTGTLVNPDGATSTWHAARAHADSLAGLYAAEVDEGKAGVIVQSDGDEISIQGAWLTQKLNTVLQVIPVMPINVESGSLLVNLPRPSGLQQLRVDPVYASAHATH